MYQQNNPQQPFQQPFGPNGPMQGPPTQFTENRPQFNPGQFQGPLQLRQPVSSRASEYGPRGPLVVAGGPMQGPNFNCSPHQPPYHPPMQPPFQNTGGIMQENRPVQSNQGNQGNQGSLLQGNPGGGSLLGNPNMLPGNPPNMMLPGGNLPIPVQGFPRQQQPLPSSQGPPMQNIPPNMQMPSQPPFDNRLPPFHEPHFENRNAYDARGGYHPDQVPNSPFNNTVPQQSASNVSHSVSLPPGHKILINPHFRGTVQPANDGEFYLNFYQLYILFVNSICVRVRARLCAYTYIYTYVYSVDTFFTNVFFVSNHNRTQLGLFGILINHKFLTADSFHNPRRHIRIKDLTISPSKVHRSINKAINRIKAM